MDGVMVAYHNTERIFGFQYIPVKEMDERLFGPEEGIGERVFDKCIGLLEAIFPEAAACYPEQVREPYTFDVPFYIRLSH